MGCVRPCKNRKKGLKLDEIDQAQEREEIGLADAIRAARAQRPAIVATGVCLYCLEPVPYGHRWCIGGACRDAWCKERGQK